MLFFKSKIDQLEEKQNKLIQKREDLKSKTAFKNSKIEAKITKLQEKAFANREYLDKFVASTELKLAKNSKKPFTNLPECGIIGSVEKPPLAQPG